MPSRGSTVENARELLSKLRWKEDSLIVNDFGETVWLKACFLKGERIGITDCCFASDPCNWHGSFPADYPVEAPNTQQEPS